MKQTMRYIVAMAAVLWMAIPQVKAQGLEEDFDPGIMYIMRGEEININFEEANEWEITFTSEDTLGYTYQKPVGMILEGGLDNDSMYVPLQTVDSIVMYQPEPVMQNDVFEITRDYFPYIVGRERTMKIRFAADIPLPLPVEGQKVVCNIFEEPLPRGFVGTVDSIYTEGNEIVIVRRKNVGPLDRYYQSLLYSGSGAYTSEEQEAIAKVGAMYRVRRGVPVMKAKSKLDWSIGYTDNGVNFGADWNPGEIDKSTDEKKKGQISFKLGGKMNFSAAAKVNTSVTKLAAAKIGLTLEYGMKGSLEATFTAEAKDKIQILGLAKEAGAEGDVHIETDNLDIELPFSAEAKFAMGMYADLSAKAELAAKGELDAKTIVDIEVDGFDFKHTIRTEPKEPPFKWGMDATLEGSAKIIFGLEGGVDLCGLIGGEVSFGLLYPEMTGKLKSWRSSDEEYDFDKVTPAQLKSYYKTFDDGNQITQGIGAYYKLGAGIGDIVIEYNAEEIVKEEEGDGDKEEGDGDKEEEEEEEGGDGEGDDTWLKFTNDGMELKGKLLGIEIEGKLSKDYETWEITAKSDVIEAKVEKDKWIFTIKGVGKEIEDTKYWFNYDYHLVYGMNMETSNYTVGETDGDNRKYFLHVKGGNRVLTPQTIHLWAYNHENATWTKKKLGEVESLPKKPKNFDGNVMLRRGRTYSVMPVYQVINPLTILEGDFYMSDAALIDSMLIPYDQYIVSTKSEGYDIVKFSANIDELMVSDFKAGRAIETGYVIKHWNGTEILREKIDLSNLSLTIYEGACNVITFEPGEYTIAMYQKVGGHEEVLSDPVTFERIDPRAPILQPINHSEDISFRKGLTFRAIVNNVDFDQVGFEILTYNLDKVVMEELVVATEAIVKGSEYELTLDHSDLTPSQLYEVRAVTVCDGQKFYSQDRFEFTAPSPIFDIKAEAEYETATLQAVVPMNVINPTNPGTIPSYVEIYFQVTEKDNVVGGDWEFVSEEDIHYVPATTLGTADIWGLSCDIYGLKDNTEYCYRVYIKLSSTKTLYSDSKEFKTKDAYTVKYTTDAQPRIVTITASCTDYAASKDNARIRFYLSTSKSNVENEKESCTIMDCEISGKKAVATFKDLDFNTTYYYKGILTFEEKEEGGNTKTVTKKGTVNKVTTPDPFQIETKDAVVEDAMVTLKATISDAALAEMKSGNYNTIYPAFDLVTKEHESDLKQGTASTNVTRITDLTQDGVNLSVDVYLEPGTEYCFRSLIYVDGKEYYGATKTFKTLEYDGGLIPLVRKYRTNPSAPWVPIIVKPEERHLAIPLKELIKE